MNYWITLNLWDDELAGNVIATNRANLGIRFGIVILLVGVLAVRQMRYFLWSCYKLALTSQSQCYNISIENSKNNYI